MTDNNPNFFRAEEVLFGLGKALDATIADLGDIEQNIALALASVNDPEGFQSLDFSLQRLENILLVLNHLSVNMSDQRHISKSEVENLVNLEFVSDCLGLRAPQTIGDEIHSKIQREELF